MKEKIFVHCSSKPKTEYFQILLYLKIKNTLFLLNYIFLIAVIILYTASTTAAGAAKFLAASPNFTNPWLSSASSAILTQLSAARSRL